MSLPLLFFGALLAFARRAQRRQQASGCDNTFKNWLPTFVIGLYVASASLVYFVDAERWYPYFHASSFTLANFLVYGAVLSLCLLPALKLRPIPSTVTLPRGRWVKHLMLIMAMFGWYAFLYQLPYALQGLAMGALNLRAAMTFEGIFLLPDSPLTTVAVGVSAFYIFYIAFFYIALASRYGRVIQVSLLVGSLSFVVSGLSFATRDVAVFYLLSFLFIHFYFRETLSTRVRVRTERVIIVIGALLLSLMALFSVQRFVNEERSELAWGTVGYLAGQPYVFAETVERHTDYYEGRLRFPIFRALLTGELSPVARTANYETMFGTFIKDLYAEGGYVLLFVFTFGFAAFFYFKLKRPTSANFISTLILAIVYFQFMSEGVFYLKLGSRSGNIYLIILVVTYFLSRMTWVHRRA